MLGSSMIISVILRHHRFSVMSDVIPSFLDVTPFGPYCKICNESLAIQKGIVAHGKEKHPESQFNNTAVIREVHRRMGILQKLHANDLSPFLTEKRSIESIWFCTVCFSAFNKSCNYSRHLEVRKNACSGSTGGKMPCYITICGRVGPRSCNIPSTAPVTITSRPTVISTPSVITGDGSNVSGLTDVHSQLSGFHKSSLSVEHDSKVPTTLLITSDEASSILSPFVRPDENVQDLCLIYYPLLSPGFEGKMREYIAYSGRQAAEDGILYSWIQAGHEWLEKYAAGHIANVSANVRSRLAEFEQRELDGAVVGSRTFTLRRGISRLMSELDSILRFFYRYPSTIFDDFKSQNVSLEWMIQTAIIPKILFVAAAEEPEDHGRLPVACQYALSRGFTTKQGYDLIMNECGWFASRISALLHLLRAGVCGYLVTLSGNNQSEVLTIQEMEIVSKIQNGRVTNLLGPYVKRLRDLNAQKPRLKTNTVNSNGDITSGAFTFPYSIWSTIIPRVVMLARACFEEIFSTGNWKLFMDKPINMTNWVKMEASVMDDPTPPGRQVWLSDLHVCDNVEPLLARLQSIAELCFFGLGVGAMRHEEVVRLTVLSCQWHNSYLYFWSQSLKRGSLKASTRPKLVEHRLSLSLSRVVLLIRYATNVASVFDKKSMLSNYSEASMTGLLQDIFLFDCQPEILNVRHLFTSIGNVLVPENNAFGEDGCIVSTSALTEKSGHTQLTGRHAYGTWLEHSDEILYDRYHSQLGETSLDPPVIAFTPYSDQILKTSLRELLGRKAGYRSDDQKKMIEIAANSVARHSFVGLPCGHGKSLSWMVPTLASYLSGRHVGLRLVILPYKFLLGHLVQHAVSMLGLLHKKLSVAFLTSVDIDKEKVPMVLEGKDVPALLFLNLDGAADLFRFHMARLQKLASDNILKRVYVDELQQLVVEYGFRSSYQSLRELGNLGVPVMTLSGSIPFCIAMSLMSYCGLAESSEINCLDIVKPTDPVGEGFSFDTMTTKDVAGAIVEFVMKSREGACHVLCSSLALVDSVTKALSKTLKVLSITGDSSYQEQIRCAKNWYNGEYDVLVSTIVGLVGNENKFCKTIVVGGFLFNVSSLVQAIGRLRPSQRGVHSKVQVIRFPFHSSDRADAKEKGDALFKEVHTAGCVNVDSEDVFKKVFSPIGLQEVLSLQSGCYLQVLSGFYGFARLPCGRCGLCCNMGTAAIESSAPLSSSVASPVQVNECDTPIKVSSSPDVSLSDARVFYNPSKDGEEKLTVVSNIINPYKKRTMIHDNDSGTSKKNRQSLGFNGVVLFKQKAEVACKISKELKRKAKWVFCEMLYRCLLCGSACCNGELCLGGSCYRCGERRHKSKACTFGSAKMTKILQNKGVCFACFDTLQHTMVYHEKDACPYKRRLKRLLFHDRERKGLSFENHLVQVYASELSFVSMVASFSKNTMLGR